MMTEPTRATLVRAILLALACAMLMLPCMALESRVLVISERGIIIGLDPSFEISTSSIDNTTEGIFSQMLFLTSSKSDGSAIIQVGSIYDPAIKSLPDELFSRQWILGVLSSSAPMNGTIAENWTAKDSSGMDVTVFTVRPEGPELQAYGGTMHVANWNIGQDTYAGILSFFNRSITSSIIEKTYLA